MQASVKLHIGSGRTRIAGFVNIDQIPDCDLQLDLNKEPLPFADDSVDCVFTFHALEHFENYLFVLGEIWRVLRHGGRLLVAVPYVTLSEYNLVNPYHKQHFNEHSFAFFEVGRLKECQREQPDPVHGGVAQVPLPAGVRKHAGTQADLCQTAHVQRGPRD